MQTSRKFSGSTIRFFVAILFSLFFSTLIYAQQNLATQGPADLIVKTSTASGTYQKLFEQISAVCTTPSLQGSESAGTLDAYNDMLTNKANVAFIPTDVLWGKKLVENDAEVDNLKVLMPLYVAELHIIASRMNANINKFSDLGNKKIGAYGSGYVTARILLGNANLRPVSLDVYGKEADLIAALKAGKIDAGFIVVGQPAGWATGLSGNDVKLVEFDRMDVASRVGGYVTANLRYPNLSVTAVKTIGVKVNLVTYNYESQKKIKDLTALRTCIKTHIADLRETTGNHPKWRDVDVNAKSDWPMFNATVSTKK